MCDGYVFVWMNVNVSEVVGECMCGRILVSLCLQMWVGVSVGEFESVCECG